MGEREKHRADLVKVDHQLFGSCVVERFEPDDVVGELRR